jgi:hypothetical protein|tara:strand:- start:11140 stop:12525 length:1386 start_codon:yes stop_codon:yes gene_type:complete
MKKLFKILLFSLLIISCEKNIIGDFDGLAGDPIIEVEPTGDALLKKGVCFANKTTRWSHKANELGVHWMYSWGSTMSNKIPENIDFVPMFWGKGSVSDLKLDHVKELIAQGKINTVLGFNEPDKDDQANMKWEDAIALWPQLEALGVPLGAPAPANLSNLWLENFMKAAKENNLRVDYITVHHYAGPSVPALVNKLKTLHDKYGLPIWITEFAVADWGVATKEDNRFSTELVEAFMKGVLPELDKLDFVQRYSWFDGSNGAGAGVAALYTSSLYDENDNLTSLGQIYANHRPNINVGPGIDTDFVVPFDPDELMVNGHFEGGTYSNVISWGTWDAPKGWTGYQSTVAYDDVTAPYTGFYSARLLKGSSALVQVVDVEETKTYVYKVHSKWAEDFGHKMKVVFKDDVANKKIKASDALSSSTDWAEHTGEITIPAGVTKLRITLWNDKDEHFYFDDFSVKLK